MECCNNVRVPAAIPSFRRVLNMPPFRLTGLLSFMLSDEITTGSVNTTDSDKRAWARKSHSWNIQQRKFKEAFPEVCYLLPRMTNSLWVRSTVLPQCVTCLTWVSRHEGSHLIQPHLSNQRHNALSNNPGLSLPSSRPRHHRRKQKQKLWPRPAPAMLLAVGLTLSGRSGDGVFLSPLL